MWYKDWQYPNTYLVSLKQLKQKLWNNESFPSCLYFTTTIITLYSIQFFLLKGIVTPHLGPNVLTLHVLYDLLKTWWVEQWSHVKDIWVCIRCIIVAVLYVKCLCAWRGPWAETQSQPPLPLIPHILLSPWLSLQCFCVVWWQACVPQEGNPPKLYPHAPVPGSISFSVLAPSRIGSNISLWSPVSLSSLCGLWGPSHSLALRFSLYHVLFFSLVAFYSFKSFPLFSIRRLCLGLSLFYPFLRSPQAPQWDPCFPSQRCLSALLSSSIPAHGKSWRQSALFINSFIWFGLR